MKSNRLEAIMEIVEGQDVETQEELASLLRERKFSVTQATISRDIKELRLIKTLSDQGVYKYAVMDKDENKSVGILMRIFAESVISIEPANHLIVIKTLSGSANAACEAVDTLRMQEIAGTLAGDNTIFLALKEGVSSQEVIRKLRRLMK